MAILAQQNVLGLDIPVNNPLGVKLGQSLANPSGQPHRLLDRQLALFFEQVEQAAPGQVLHNHVEPFAFDAQAIDGHHVGMLQSRGNPALLNKPFDRRFITGFFEQEFFDGHPPVQHPITGFKNRAKATLPKRANDLILQKLLTRG